MSLSGWDLMNVGGFLLTIIGIWIAIYQTMRARSAEKDFLDQKRIRNAEIWHNIALTLNAYDTLEDARVYSKSLKTKDAKTEAIFAKLSSARRSIVDQYLGLMRSAVLDEAHFDEETLNRWIAHGRLENTWRVKQARKFIRDYDNGAGSTKINKL